MLQSEFEVFRACHPFRKTIVSIGAHSVEVEYQEVEARDPDSEVLVLLPPIAGSCSSWFPQLAFLKALKIHTRVLSVSFPVVEDVQSLVVVLDLFLDALEVTQKVHLGGCGEFLRFSFFFFVFVFIKKIFWGRIWGLCLSTLLSTSTQ